MSSVEKTGKTVDEAIENALQELGITKEDAVIEVLGQASKGKLLGMLGSKDARVRVTKKDADSDAYEAQGGDDEDIDEAYDSAAHANMEDGDSEHADMENADVEDDEAESENAFLAVDPEEGSIAELLLHFLQDVFQACDANVQIQMGEKNEALAALISSADAPLGKFIGRRGEALDALQYLCSIIVNQNTEEYIKVYVDIENYREKREDTLIELADRIAGKVIYQKRPYTLEPMNPYERRIIHMALQGRRNIRTYSVGDEPNRKVVVQYSR